VVTCDLYGLYFQQRAGVCQSSANLSRVRNR
jgi:hypothetical protein